MAENSGILRERAHSMGDFSHQGNWEIPYFVEN